VLEAMAFGVLVIGSDIDANRELVGPEQVRESADEVAGLLRAVLTQRDRRADLLEEQRERSRRFAASRMVADWLRIYERLAARSRRRPSGRGFPEPTD
jgi:glycosyltransferase involved in cell wall biosynthesis